MKVGIIGAGLVGATAAYAIALRGAASSIVLVDLNEKRAIAEASDIQHAIPFIHSLAVAAGGYAELQGSHAVIVAAGVSQKPGESRLALLQRNAAVMNAIVPSIFEHAPEAILVIATNPVDIMTHVATQAARAYGIPSSRVMGSGTTLDTARFKSLLGEYVGVDAQHVHGYVLGEHGDSEVLTWSLVDVGGTPLERYVQHRHIPWTPDVQSSIDARVRNAAYTIIEGKGATYYGVGAALARIVDVLAHDHRALMTVCTTVETILGVPNVTLSLPNLVGGQGVIDTLPLQLNEKETQALHHSAELLHKLIVQLD